jgi:D-serine deaminase-like pyridoxal phosphate-dependent protein
MDLNEWYEIQETDNIDSPALLIYLDRIKSNLEEALHIVGSASRLRPHVKTCKIAEVCEIMLQKGVTKFKCATIAEAEMLGMIKAPDVLLAYQPVGPKLERFLALASAYPDTVFSCLADNEGDAKKMAERAAAHGVSIPVFIDINVGMNRTGILPNEALALAQLIEAENWLKLEGLHAYDGHIADTDLELRKERSDAAMEPVLVLQEQLENLFDRELKVVAGGTPTFTIHANRADFECSPGTFIFWDHSYSKLLPDLPFQPAAVLLTRVISIVDEQTICIDLGHKSVSAEMQHPRMHFLNQENLVPVSQSEEHLTLTVSDSSIFKTGDPLYAVPMHVCPTVALHERVYVVADNEIIDSWKTIARDRKISI